MLNGKYCPQYIPFPAPHNRFHRILCDGMTRWERELVELCTLVFMPVLASIRLLVCWLNLTFHPSIALWNRSLRSAQSVHCTQHICIRTLRIMCKISTSRICGIIFVHSTNMKLFTIITLHSVHKLWNGDWWNLVYFGFVNC